MTGNYVQDPNWRLPPVYFLKLNNMKLRILKKKHPSKLDRIWIKHLIEWIKLETEYKSIKRYYIKSCKEKLWK